MGKFVLYGNLFLFVYFVVIPMSHVYGKRILDKHTPSGGNKILKIQNNQSNTSPHVPNILLVGLTGCGKTTVGRLLAYYLGWGFLDTDHLVELVHKDTVTNILDKNGIKEFRKIEANVLTRILAVKNHVISLGGGALLERSNRARLNQLGTIIWIDVSIQNIAWRFLHIDGMLAKRPLLWKLENLRDEDVTLRFKAVCDRLDMLLAERISHFNRSKLVVNADYLSAEMCAFKIKYLIQNS